MTVRTGDQLPHFEATGLDGRRTAYRDVWQRQNLLLVTLPEDDGASAAYAQALAPRIEDLAGTDTAVVITRDRIPGLPSTGVVIADRWGEIGFVQGAGDAAQLPPADELLDWLRFVQMRCPECEGEWR